jgi:hypothetical protein
MKRMIFVVFAMALFLLAPLSAVWSGWVKSMTPTIPTSQGLNGVNDLYFINPDTGIAVGFVGGVYKTTDGGFLWKQLPLPLGRQVDLWSVCFINSLEGWVGADGIAHTTDGAMNWEIEHVPEPEPFTLFAAAIVGDEIWFLGWYDELTFNPHGILIRRPIRGGTWSVRKFPEFGGFFGIKVIAPDNVWLYGTNTVVQTTDLGQTFVDRSEGVRDAQVNFKQIAFDKQNPQSVYLVGNSSVEWGGKFSASIDGGQTWILRKIWGGANKEFGPLGLAIVDSTIYVTGGGYIPGYSKDRGLIFASTDDGKTWREVARDTTAINTTFHTRIVQIDSTMVVAWRTFWYFVPNRLPLFSTAYLDSAKEVVIPIGPQYQHQHRVLATDPDGDPLTFSFLKAPDFLHLDPDSGWVTNTATLADQGKYLVIIQVSDPEGATATLTAIWTIGEPQSTAVEETEALGLPTKFALRQNFPNPFNPETTIEYSLAEASGVRLSVLDLLGQELIVLVSERQLPGAYSVRFTAANLPSGVYFLRLASGGKVQTRRMLLLK